MRWDELFYLEETSNGHWTVRHRYTDVPAGDLVETPRGLALSSDSAYSLGSFVDLDAAFAALYALA